MVVIFLMSLIVGISTIFFANTLPTAKFRATARELAATIKFAKHLAAAKNEIQTVDIDLDGRTYAMSGQKAKLIPPGVVVTIRQAEANANPILQGKYSLSYDATGGSDWEQITLSKGVKIITIKSDPIAVALVMDKKENERNQ
jgi:Tfp pilus assembly protein FimT